MRNIYNCSVAINKISLYYIQCSQIHTSTMTPHNIIQLSWDVPFLKVAMNPINRPDLSFLLVVPIILGWCPQKTYLWNDNLCDSRFLSKWGFTVHTSIHWLYGNVCGVVCAQNRATHLKESINILVCDVKHILSMDKKVEPITLFH